MSTRLRCSLRMDGGGAERRGGARGLVLHHAVGGVGCEGGEEAEEAEVVEEFGG